MTKITFLGLGAMGHRMAKRLLSTGYDVTVWNRTASRADGLVALGARIAPTPRAGAEGADLVLSMVRDDIASQEVWLDAKTGAVHSLGAQAVAVEMSTLSPAHIATLADNVAATGATFIDAPLLGSRPQADAGQLIFLVGGSASAFQRAQPVLLAMGGATHHVGEIGHGSRLKLLANALFAAQVAMVAETLTLGQVSGLDPQSIVDILGALPIVSPAAKTAMNGMVARNFAPMFPIDLVEKDLGYVSQWAQAHGTPAPIASHLHDVFVQAQARGLGSNNITGILNFYEQTQQAPQSPH